MTTRRVVLQLDKEVEKDKWGMTPPTINAYYTPTKNQVIGGEGLKNPTFVSSTLNWPSLNNFLKVLF
jgi:predicted metalloendopeptidase